MILRRLPSLPTWSTGFRELDVARRDMERLFDALTSYSGHQAAGVFPAINVSEDGESIYVRAELPGIEGDDLDISIEKETVVLAKESLAAIEGKKGLVIQQYLIEYLLKDEEKHDAILANLEGIKKNMYPYG